MKKTMRITKIIFEIQTWTEVYKQKHTINQRTAEKKTEVVKKVDTVKKQLLVINLQIVLHFETRGYGRRPVVDKTIPVQICCWTRNRMVLHENQWQKKIGK